MKRKVEEVPDYLKEDMDMMYDELEYWNEEVGVDYHGGRIMFLGDNFIIEVQGRYLVLSHRLKGRIIQSIEPFSILNKAKDIILNYMVEAEFRKTYRKR